MNATKTGKAMILIAGALIMLLTACTNPAGPSLNLGNNTPVIEDLDGIVSNPATGLIAGMDLEGDNLFTNPDVTVTSGVEWVPGLSGNAFRGDSDGEFIRVVDGSLPELTVSGSIEAWVFPEGTNVYSGIVHKGDNRDYTDEAWSLQFYYDLKPYFFVYCDDGAGTLTAVDVISTVPLTMNTWSHLAATWTYDAVTEDIVLRLYVNGNLVVTETRNGIGPVRESDGDMIIGSQIAEQWDATYGHFSFKGIIDEVSLYDRVRSAEEVAADYQVYAP